MTGSSSQPRNDRGHDGHSTKAERGSPPPCISLHDGSHQFAIRENTYDETLLGVGSQFASSPCKYLLPTGFLDGSKGQLTTSQVLETVPQSIELSSN